MNKCIVGAIIVLAMVGCSRKSDNSSVSFSLPQSVSAAGKVGQQALTASSSANDPVLSHVVLNISGPNMTAIIRNYDKHNGGIPSAISIDVPKGDNRLIQVLAVYQTPINQAMSFYYGDVVKSLSNANESADILVTSMGGAASPISGNIFGRYFNSTAGGPTADVATMFNPGAGKPRMIIERSTMFNGWFSVFALSSVPLEYEIQPQAGAGAPELMWGGPVTLNSPALVPSAITQNYLMRMASPVSVREQNDGGGATYEVEEPRYSVWGFWKKSAAVTPDPLTNLNVCRESGGLFGTQLTKMKKFDLNDTTWASQPGLNGASVSIGSSMPTDNFLSNVSAPASQYFYQGGNPSSCGNTNDIYSLYLRVTRDMVDGNGNDNAGGFRAPFRVDSMGSPMTITSSDSQRVLTAQLLPGVAGRIDELRIFKKTGLGNDYHDDDEIECGDLQKGAMGYVFAGATQVDNTGNISLTANITDAEASGGTSAVICSGKGGKLFAGGLRLGTWAFNSGGGGSSGPPAKLGTHTNMVGGPANCKTVNVEIQDASGSTVSGASNPSPLTVNLSGGGINFYDTCAGSTISSLQISAGSATASFGMSASVQGSYSYSFSAAGLTNANGNYIVAPSGAVALLEISDLAGNYINALPNSSCVPFKISSYDSFHNLANAYASSTLTLVTEPGLSYYSDGACTTLTSSLNIIASTSQAVAYVKATMNGQAHIRAFITAYDPDGSFTPYALDTVHATPVGSAGTPVYLSVSGAAGFNYNQCYPLTVVSNDAFDATANMPTAATGITISSRSGGDFFANSTDCTNTTPILSPSLVTIAQGTASSNVIYFRAPNGGGSSVRIEVMHSSGGGIGLTGYGNFSLSP